MVKVAVGQGGGPTPVINDTLAGIVEGAQLRSYEVVGLSHGFQGGGLHPEIDGNLVDLTRLEPDSLRGIPGAFLGTSRMKLKPGQDDDLIARVQGNLKRLGIDGIIYIGGNDSAGVLNALGNGIHAEKTIDNDLLHNDHTSGWGSACLTNVQIIRALALDLKSPSVRIMYGGRQVYDTAPVVVYQAMGRNTGWLSLGTAFAKISSDGSYNESAAPHIILPREILFNEDQFLGEVDNTLRKLGWAFIVCGEEVIDENRTTLAEKYGAKETKDGFGQVQHARSGSFNYAGALARLVKDKLGSTDYLTVKETPITPQHIQRSLMSSQLDADEAYKAGKEAVRAFSDGHSNVSIALHRINQDKYQITPARVPLESVASGVRPVDSKYLAGLKGPTQEFYSDFLPLVASPVRMNKQLF